MNDLFFYSSKIVWKLISPDNLFVIFLVAAWVLLLLRRVRAATVIVSILSVIVLALSFFPIGSWFLYPLESQFKHNPELPEQVDGIIVLGGSILPRYSREWQQLETNDAHERLSSFIELAKRFPDAKLVFTGGNGGLDRSLPTEAEIAEPYFLRAGLDTSRLVIESKARNTAENARYVQNMVNPQQSEAWILVTTAFHMPRSIGVFCQNGIHVIPYPVDHKTHPKMLKRIMLNLTGNAQDLMFAAHEWTGLLAYYLSGKIPEILPGECQL